MPSWVMDTLAKLRDPSVTYTHDAVRTRKLHNSSRAVPGSTPHVAPAVYDRYQYGVNLPYNMIVAGDSIMKVNPLYR